MSPGSQIALLGLDLAKAAIQLEELPPHPALTEASLAILNVVELLKTAGVALHQSEMRERHAGES